MEPQLYKKVFKIDENNNLYLSNPEPLIKEINGWLNDLLCVRSKQEAFNKKLEIVDKFLKIYKYDKKTAIFPEPLGIFEKEEDKQRFIEKRLLLDDMSAYLGELYRNYHAEILRRGWHFPNIDEQFQNEVIKYNEVYNTALNEYALFLLNIKPNQGVVITEEWRGLQMPRWVPLPDNIPKLKMGEHVYITTFIIPVLIERFLIIQVEYLIIKEQLLKSLLDKINKKEITLEQNEQEFIDEFCRRGDKKYYFNFRKILYDIFVKYKIVEETDEELKLIILENMKIKNEDGTFEKKMLTLGSLLSLVCVKKMIKRPYFKLLHMLFDSDGLDIRNNIMHGNNETFNYFSANLTSVMVQVLIDIMNWEIFYFGK